MTTTAPHTTTDAEATEIIRQIAAGYGSILRSPVLGTPADQGLAYEDVTFPSADGTPLEAWFIPREGSDKLIIANHPLWFSRTGLPAHLEPWRSLGALGGNDFAVDFLPDYRILHDAGYNVLTYDMRNLGQSGSANGGRGSGGRFEARDVIGSLHFARSDARTRGMTIGLFSRCQGANATMFAMQEHPEEFEDVRCMLAPQPLSVGVTMRRSLELLGIPGRIDDLEREIQLQVSHTFAEMTPVTWARSVQVPTYLYQVRDDLLTDPSDVQGMFDNIPVAEKELHWIEGTTARWDGYLDFQRDPQPKLDFLARHMS
ncbi:alpha/beta hydrolase family protein [Promicromonospora thailandica]|uniref:Alpha/beta hydrolase family protein n=1 Tax=Promicromonospora thailandica TaxID=765201 RepID=A0A9X2FXE2_9MICO|nr:lysophospholipase [Promicromonospora thailandica]MCP2262889.1 Alpha/beta hydrolase family protein [Promicromonospora thailandica]